MKKMKFACNISLLTLVALGQWACAWDPYEHDSDPVRETLELTASASQIALDENDLTATVLTFDWTPARPMSDEYLVSYKTKLDLLTNNFGSATTIETSEDDGIFSRSYTSEQLNNWANERWKVPVNKTFTLVRTGKLIERVKKYNPEARDLIQDFHVLWPIPQAVRDANTGEFPQNPGYEGYEG